MRTKVLLIHPPVNTDLVREQIVGAPLIGYGLLHIAASLIQKGHDVAVWNLENAMLRGNSVSDIEAALKSQDPSVVGIELNWLTYSRGAIQIAELSKRAHPGTPVAIGGTHASLFAPQILQLHHSAVDIVLKGEAEKTFPQLVENIETNGGIGEVGGSVFYQGEHMREMPLAEDDIYANMDDVPPYSYKVVVDPNLGSPEPVPEFVAINTTRGPCPMDCAYCVGSCSGHLSGRTSFSAHSPEWIVNQMNLLIEEGVNEFAFQDIPFLIGKKRLCALAEALLKEGINEKIVGVNMTAIPGVLDEETLDKLSEAGIYNIDYGAESGSDRVLRVVNRCTSRQNIMDTVQKTIGKGIIPWTYWMTGLPGERMEDVRETSELVRATTELGALPKWVTPLVVLPGTRLFEKSEEYGIRPLLRSFEDFTVFSRLERRAASWYPEAISHESNHMSKYDILKSSIDLKLEIFNRREEMIEGFMGKFADMVLSRHPQLSAENLRNEIGLRLSNILSTFF